MVNERINVLIPDGEHFYLQKVLNCIGECAGHMRLYVLSSKRYTSMRFSRYIHKYIYYPVTNDDRQWVGKINEIGDAYKIDVIMPLFEDRIRTLICLRDLLNNPESLLLADNVALFDTANHKGILARHLEKYQVPGPLSMEFENSAQLRKHLNGLPFPLLAKPPLNTGGGDGILFIKDRESMLVHLEKSMINFPMVFQQFVRGFDTGCNVLCKDGRILAYTIQQGFLYEKKPYSPQIGLDTIYKKEVLDMVTRLMESLHWSGIANVDMMYDLDRNHYIILEVNPRFWSTLEGSLTAGVNFPWFYCQAVLSREFNLPEYKEVRYLSLKGLISSIKRDWRILFDKKQLWEHSQLKYAFKDPAPVIYHFFWRTRNMLLNKFRKSAEQPHQPAY